MQVAWHDGPKKRQDPRVDAYIAALDDAQRRICARVREILKEDPDVLETIAWGVPAYFRRGPLCYTSAASRHVTIGWFKGAWFADGSGFLTGTGKSPIRKWTCGLSAWDEDAFRGMLQPAVALDESGEEPE